MQGDTPQTKETRKEVLRLFWPAVLTDTMSQRWAPAGCFLLDLIVVVLFLLLLFRCAECVTTSRPPGGASCPHKPGDVTGSRKRSSAGTDSQCTHDGNILPTRLTRSADLRSDQPRHKHAVGFSLDRFNSNSRSWTRWRWGWRRCQWWRGVNINSSGPDWQLLSNIFLLSVFFVFFIDLNVSINKIFKSCS